jgi:hypothetical protein
MQVEGLTLNLLHAGERSWEPLPVICVRKGHLLLLLSQRRPLFPLLLLLFRDFLRMAVLLGRTEPRDLHGDPW